MSDPKENLSFYPNLEKSFNSLPDSIKGSLTFGALEKQLAGAFNDLEQKRAIHRLHCVITALLSKDTIYFEKLSDAGKQALIVLTILDGCKNSKESIDAFSSKRFTALKDGVPSLFDMVAKAPEIFPIYDQLSEEAKRVIKNDFFYLHLRHLQLGEVPVASVSSAALARPRDLMVAFWYANATGFAVGKKDYPAGESTGPTITEEQRTQFANLLVSMEKGNLTDYYAENSIFKTRKNLEALFTRQEVEFICRLGKMLSFIDVKEDDNDYAVFVYHNERLIKALVSLETKTFSEHNIEAFTFLPAVLGALKGKVMAEKQTGDILGVFLCLQRQLYRSAPSIVENLGANRTIPLFGLANNQHDMLIKFANSNDKEAFHFEASMGSFININLVDGPVQERTNTNQAMLSKKNGQL